MQISSTHEICQAPVEGGVANELQKKFSGQFSKLPIPEYGKYRIITEQEFDQITDYILAL